MVRRADGSSVIEFAVFNILYFQDFILDSLLLSVHVLLLDSYLYRTQRSSIIGSIDRISTLVLLPSVIRARAQRSVAIVTLSRLLLLVLIRWTQVFFIERLSWLLMLLAACIWTESSTVESLSTC